MSNLTDRLYERLLVIRCQTGDETAFAELVERYGQRLRYFVKKMLGPEGEVDDTLQDVWLDVWRSVTKLTEPAAFATWVYRIARDRAYRGWRRRVPEPRPVADLEQAFDDADESFSADDAARIHEGLGKLAPEQREILILRFLEAMSYDEIARVVGCPLGTVRSRLHYAKQSLKKVLETEMSNE